MDCSVNYIIAIKEDSGGFYNTYLFKSLVTTVVDLLITDFSIWSLMPVFKFDCFSMLTTLFCFVCFHEKESVL